MDWLDKWMPWHQAFGEKLEMKENLGWKDNVWWDETSDITAFLPLLTLMSPICP